MKLKQRINESYEERNTRSYNMSDRNNDMGEYSTKNSKGKSKYDKESHTNNTLDTETEIKTYLKALVQEKHPIKKLMISSILSSLYIQTYNYQEAHEILTNIQTTIEKFQFYSFEKQKEQQNSIFSKQDYLELAVIIVKMFANFILIAIINVQVELFEKYLKEALNFVQNFLNGHKFFFNNQKEKSELGQKYSSENSNPNINYLEELSKHESIQFSIMLFKLLLKSFSGYESFEQIRAETLIAECQSENYENGIENFFYFSNISFLKLLSTSDYQSAYKLEVHAYDFIEADIEASEDEVSLKQVILKTVSLKKLLYLAEELKLPSEIIKMYKQKLYSTESLQSQYLEGLQENTIFRNYNEKINLGFRLITQLKTFEKECIIPIEMSSQSRARKIPIIGEENPYRLEIWECKALKNRFIQLLTSKSLESNLKTKENIILLINTLNSIISRHSSEGNRSENSENDISVEEKILLQCIGYIREKEPSVEKGKKQPISLYESAVIEYRSRLEIFCSSLTEKLIIPVYEYAFEKLEENEEPEISVEVYEDQENVEKNGKEDSSSDSEPSIYLEDVEFEVIGNKEEKKEKEVQKKVEFGVAGKKEIQHVEKSEPKKTHEAFKEKEKFTNIYKNEERQRYREVETSPQSKSPQQQKGESMIISKSPRRNIFLNEKNEVYMNYTEIGSRVKLNHLKPTNKEEEVKKIESWEEEQKRNAKVTKKMSNYHQESIKKEEGEIEIPHEESIVKLLAKKYPFEEKENDRISPEPLQQEKIKSQKVDSIFEKFKHENKIVYDSKITEKIDEEKSMEQKSMNKSRKKLSSLSPKVPKDSTINSKLNEHIRRHELSYSPESRTSGIKSKQFNREEKEEELSSYSAGLSPSEKSRSKIKPKVEKASGYLKSPKSSAINLQNKTIKFKEYMENLEKSGVNINEGEITPKNTFKPKVESKISHKRNATEMSEIPPQNYESYMTGMTSKLKGNQGNSGILEGFLAEPAEEAVKSMIKYSPENQILSKEKETIQYEKEKENYFKHKKTGSELISLQKQVALEKHEFPSEEKKLIGTQSTVPAKDQEQTYKVTKSELVNNVQNIQNPLKSPISSILSPEMVSNYVMKMIKSHKVKLNHAIKLCENGQYVDKKHYSSDGGDERFLQLSLDHKNLEWAVTESKLLEGHKSKYEIKNIKGVVFGQVTETMRKGTNKNLESFKCISFIFQKRSFDVYLAEENDSKFWLPGISYCVSQSRPQLNHPNYTTKIEKFIKKRELPIKKDDYHLNTVYYSLGRVLWKQMLLKMQQKYLTKSKKIPHYKNTNAGAIIEFKKSMVQREKESRVASMLPPTGKQSKMSKEKSSQQSRVNER